MGMGVEEDVKKFGNKTLSYQSISSNRDYCACYLFGYFLYL
jgi:hypothetical protein